MLENMGGCPDTDEMHSEIIQWAYWCFSYLMDELEYISIRFENKIL